MSNRPHDWYSMTHDQRRKWEQQESARQDLEYERDQAREEAERSARQVRQAQQYARAEVQSAREDLEVEMEARREAESQAAMMERYLRHTNQWEAFCEWEKCWPGQDEDE